jgi:hypothetical protein
MGKITRVNIAAARSEKEILERRGKPVSEKIQKLAAIDPRLVSSSEANRAPEETQA